MAVPATSMIVATSAVAAMWRRVVQSPLERIPLRHPSPLGRGDGVVARDSTPSERALGAGIAVLLAALVSVVAAAAPSPVADRTGPRD